MPPFWTFCNGTGLLPWTKVNFSSFVQKINWRQKAISSGARESNKVMNKIACEAVVFMRKLAREGVKPKKWAAKKPGATRFLFFLLYSLSLLKLSVSEGAKKRQEEERGEAVSILLNTSIRHYKAHFAKNRFSCQNVQYFKTSNRRKVRCRRVSHNYSLCAQRQIVDVSVDLKCHNWPIIRYIRSWWTETRNWKQCLQAPLLRLSPVPTQVSRNFRRFAFPLY